VQRAGVALDELVLERHVLTVTETGKLNFGETLQPPVGPFTPG
jgi:hypothetical protein